MAITQNTFTGNGSNLGPFSFTFKWLEPTDIKVSVGGVLKTAGTHYNLQNLNYTTKTGGEVLFTSGNAPANAAAIRVFRDTDDSALSATFNSGSAIRAQDLNDNFTQNLYVTQEINNNAVQIDGSQTMVGDLNMGGYKITNLATPTASGNAATKDYVDASSGNGGIPGHTRWRRLATAGQTTFSGTGDYGGTLSYSPVREQVYLNGALQQRNADYSADNGTSITFTEALQLNDVVDVVCTNNLVSGTVSNAANINYSGQFSGQTTRTVAAKLADVVSVKDFGAVGDGVADDTAALVAAAGALQSGQQLDFGSGTYLISYQGVAYSSVNGNVVMNFLSKSDIALVGTGATIKVVDHNITAKGGLRFANFKGCKRVRIAGLNFDMTFTGVNTSASYYPFCGAITALDDDAATPSFSTLNSDFIIERCTFKLFHPFGSWALSGTSYLGDVNNGYKLLSVFTSGPYTPSNDDNLCRNLAIENCTWLTGHNGYGIWTWAWSNVNISDCIAENWSTKYSDASGVYQGGGAAFIRNIPFWAHGFTVSGCQFRSRPGAQRTGDFAGKAQFYSQANNMGAVSSGKGETLITSNNVINGGGSSNIDECIFFNDFGNLVVSSNNFDGHDSQSASVGAGGINFVPTLSGGVGECLLAVTGNTFGAWLHGYGILMTNGSNTSAASRPCRSLVVTDNIHRSGDFFLRMAGYSYYTHEGCPYSIITGNVIDGTKTSLYPPPSVNNYGIAYAANATGDVGIIANNVFINKTEPIITLSAFCSSSASLSRYGNSFYGITTPYNAANVFPTEKLEIPQLKLPGTPVLSTDPNTLDDYEEGSFTPTIIGTGTAGVGTYTTQIGRYQKIGNRVYFTVTLAWTAHTGTSNMYIGGLPFTSANISNTIQPCSVIGWDITLSANEYLGAGILNAASTINLYRFSTGTTGINLLPLDTAGSLSLSGHYETSS